MKWSTVRQSNARQSKSRLNTDKFRYICTKGIAGVMFYRDR